MIGIIEQYVILWPERYWQGDMPGKVIRQSKDNQYFFISPAPRDRMMSASFRFTYLILLAVLA
ncbi:MAG: hypothetical protein NTV68_05755, partial [Methanomicrobiales archaeon]|nr:hypothetical protein [Methanomicrobiales archaeon]